MGTIQNSINQIASTVMGGALATKHIKNQELQKQAEIAGLQETVATNEEALKNDTIEAAAAIKAHAAKEHLNEADIVALKETDPAKLQDTVERLRTENLTKNRQDRLDQAGQAYAEGPTEAAGKQLKAAYKSFRELNDRIAATRQLKFNIENAQARIKALKGGRK